MRQIVICLLLIYSSLTYADDKATVRVRAENKDGQPLANVKLSVFLWSGKWDATNITANCDAQGRAELTGIAPDNYATIVAQAQGLATTTQDLQLTAGEVRELKFQLRPPVRSTVRILDSQGAPLAGAVLSALQFIAGEGGGFFHRYGMNDPFVFEPTASDARGVIELPPMPQGSKVNLVVFHPKYQPNRVDNLDLSESELATIKLVEGVQLKFKYVLGAGLDSLPDSLTVNTSISATPKLEDVAGASLYFTRPLQSDSWQCVMSPGQYRLFNVSSRSDDFTITPLYSNDDPACASLLQLNDSQPHELELLIRKNVKVRGKLVGDLTGIGTESSATGWTENLHPTLQLAVDDHRWLPTSFSTINADGTFELLLPPGAAKLNFSGLKSALVEPTELEFQIEPGKEVVLPEIKLRKLQAITGQLVDQDQRPIGQAVVRILAGLWGSDYVTCDAEGRFSLAPDPIVNLNSDPKTPLPVSIIAFDPQSRKCACLDITNSWQHAQAMKIECSDHPKGWLIDALKHQEQRYSEARSWRQADKAYWDKFRKESEAKFATGAIGQQAPDDLSRGTWLNSQAQSLKDFRGKYVMLDFWFIGCGPCEADIPNTKLTHETLDSERFSVVSVHISSQTVDNVRGFAQQKGMTYPVVVDNDDGEIEDIYRKAGVDGFPSYILLGPDGRIIHNDTVSSFPSLRMFKAEIVWSALQK